jgi:hypothetical protein
MLCIADKNERPKSAEMADIFRMHGDDYCKAHVLTPEQHNVMNAIKNCRTSVLGGHIEQCGHCAALHCSYNSCRNRHCPKCGSFKAAKWSEDRQAELLPVSYFHVVFTLPHVLNNLVLYNKKLLYNLLFEAVWETLKTLGEDKNRLGGLMGTIAILHTWGQTLSQHNHLHCIVPGGALSKNGKWKPAKKYLFPVNVLSKLFRGIYVSKLRQAYEQGRLVLPTQLAETLLANDFDALLNQLMEVDWVVYAKPPFAGPEKLLNYLGRYTHKIAISNHRIISVDEEAVIFKWRDYSDNNQEKVMQLKPEEFIRRFLSHVLPVGFMRIRSFGFLANASKAKKVKQIQTQFNYKPRKTQEKRDTASLMLELTGDDITLCPYCKQGKLKRIQKIPSQLSKNILDSS